MYDRAVEIDEAIAAGHRALDALAEAADSLDSAKRWGIVDILGGGFVTSMVKHSRLGDANRELARAREEIRAFTREISDVRGQAGGRLSNAAFLGATLLRIKPIIELIDGKLTATKKLRGKMETCALGLMDHMALQGDYDTSVIYFVRSSGLPLSVQQAAEKHARELGFESFRWYDTQDVITSHCGPGSFAVAFPGIRK